VYNTERYFDTCARSLLNQTTKDIEILLINDGSTDKCPEICDMYQRLCPDIIKVYHRENQGQNASWNFGLSVAQGQWVCFVDSDDQAEPHMAQTMLEYAKNGNSDVYVFGHFEDYENNSLCHTPRVRTLTPREKANFVHECGDIPSSMWGKLYRRGFLEAHGLRFDPTPFHFEDTLFNIRAFRLAETVSVCGKPLYRYRITASGFTRRWCVDKPKLYGLFIQRYGEFTDEHFDTETSARMKGKMLWYYAACYADFYDDARGKLSHREATRRLSECFKREPFRSGIRGAAETGAKPWQRLNLFLLRHGLAGIWFTLRKAVKTLHKKSENKPYV
jgi:glycosyltransferase involved in cell wall biosynthesis